MTAFEVVIRLGRRFDIQTGSGSFASNVREITVAFTDRESAEAALRDIQTSVRQVHDAGGEDYRPVVAGEVMFGSTVSMDEGIMARTALMRAAILAPKPDLSNPQADLDRDMRDLRELDADG